MPEKINKAIERTNEQKSEPERLLEPETNSSIFKNTLAWTYFQLNSCQCLSYSALEKNSGKVSVKTLGCVSAKGTMGTPK